MTMNILSKVLVASALALSFAAPTLAYEAPETQTLLERSPHAKQAGKAVHVNGVTRIQPAAR
jgi:hypothetical protein